MKKFESTPYPDGTHTCARDGEVLITSRITDGTVSAVGRTLHTVLPWPFVLKIVKRATDGNSKLKKEIIELLQP